MDLVGGGRELIEGSVVWFICKGQRYFTECPTGYRTRHFFNNFTTNEDIETKFEAGYRHTLQPHTTDTHYRHTLQTHTIDTHYRRTLQTHTTETHYSHTLQTHTTDAHYRHALQTHTTDTHYRHIPLNFSHNERTPVQISLQYLHWC